MMSSCFNTEPKKRPGASTIVEFISKNPRILTPCMDVPKPCLEYQVNLIDGDQDPVERFEQMMDLHRDRSHTPATIEFLRTSVSSSALQNHLVNHHEDPSSFEYLDMNLSRKPNGICLSEFRPDLTAMLPNGNYNPVEPLLQTRPEISKSNLSLMKYMPMCGFGKNSNRSSPDECTSALWHDHDARKFYDFEDVECCWTVCDDRICWSWPSFWSSNLKSRKTQKTTMLHLMCFCSQYKEFWFLRRNPHQRRFKFSEIKHWNDVRKLYLICHISRTDS